MTTDDDLLLWLDLETTGSDEAKDSIIEIGCVLTTADLDVIEHLSLVVRPTDEALGRLLRNSVVREMHEANGLLDEVMGEARVASPHDAARTVLSWLDAHAPGEQVVLAGSGVGHFDRRFLDRWMPQVSRRLRYWCIDIGVVRRAHRMWSPDDLPSMASDAKTHRALDDAYCHLTEARAFRDLWSVVR